MGRVEGDRETVMDHLKFGAAALSGFVYGATSIFRALKGEPPSPIIGFAFLGFLAIAGISEILRQSRPENGNAH